MARVPVSSSGYDPDPCRNARYPWANCTLKAPSWRIISYGLSDTDDRQHFRRRRHHARASTERSPNGQPQHVGRSRARCGVTPVRGAASAYPRRRCPDRGSQSSECSGALSAKVGRAIPQERSRRPRAPTKVRCRAPALAACPCGGHRGACALHAPSYRWSHSSAASHRGRCPRVADATGDPLRLCGGVRRWSVAHVSPALVAVPWVLLVMGSGCGRCERSGQHRDCCAVIDGTARQRRWGDGPAGDRFTADRMDDGDGATQGTIRAIR